MFSFITKFLPGAFGLKAIAIAVGIALLSGFGSGVWVRDAFCDAASLRVEAAQLKGEIANLNKQIKARDEASEKDAARAALDSAEIATLNKRIADATPRVGAGECFNTRDTDSLRSLWRSGKPGNPGSRSR